MPDDMFFSKDEMSLHRGKRIAQRTETCRTCLLTLLPGEDVTLEGVVMDVTPYGMLIRTMNVIEPNTRVRIQLMKDSSFKIPLADPHEGLVVRHESTDDSFFDHGVKLNIKEIITGESRPILEKPSAPVAPSRRPRMHTIDYTLGDPPQRRD